MAIKTPGVNILSRSSVTAQIPPVLTDTCFIVGVTAMGRTDKPVLVRSLTDYINNFGNRVSYGTLYDWLDSFFNEANGGQVWVQRVVGTSSAALDAHTFQDSAPVNSITINSIGAATSGLSAAIVSGQSSGSFAIVITGLPDGSTLSSGDLFTVADAVNWGSTQLLIRVVAAGVNPPANHSAVALSGGSDDRADITDTNKVAGLALITTGLGCGQVMVPGATTETIYVALINHAIANNRFALLSATDSSSVSTLTSAAATLQADTVTNGAFQYGMFCADWQLIPGLTTRSTRTVDPTATVAALIARSDRSSGNPNLAAAGANGVVQYALGKTQPDWTDDQITTLVAAGVMPFHTVFGTERFFGFRTLSNPYTDSVFAMASASRLRMDIIANGYISGQAVLFGEIDGQGSEQDKYKTLISARLLQLYTLGALYGATSDEAYLVDTGADVNTPTSITNRELHAAVGIRPSPFAETVFFELAASPVNQPV